MMRSWRAISFCLPLACLPFAGRCQQGPALADPAFPPPGVPVPGCLTDELRQRQSPQVQERTARIDRMVRAHLEARAGTAREVMTIPVVVHIIHDNGSENIPDAQVQQGIADLNDAFANAGAYHTADGVDVGIRFCLAKQDPFGNASPGIDRQASILTDVTSETQDLALKSLVRWDPTHYLNIWLVREITSQAAGAGVAGYAYFPSSHGGLEDGIVNEARWFGSSTDNSKVHIHEVGHYFGLYHTFEGGCTNNDCLADGDRVCDTPPDGSSAAVPCSMAVNTCGTDDDDLSANNPFRPVAQGGLGDQPDLFADYMDYGLQVCQHLFTSGQADRMQAMLTTARTSLLSSSGCAIPCPGLLSVGFTPPAAPVSGGTYTFTNTSLVTTSVDQAWSVDGTSVSTATDLSWTFTSMGAHTVTLQVTSIDEGCQEEATMTVHVACDAHATFAMQPPTPIAGQAVALISTGQATAVQWSVDDVPAGSGSPHNIGPFPENGGHSVRLIAQGTGCADTSAYAFLPVGPCVSGENNVMLACGGSLLSFNGGGTPEVTATPMYVAGGEGISSISDRNGHLLLYTDGQGVYNGDHQMIGSGLLGGGSSTQAALIVPKPGSGTVYYIFTTDDWVGTSGGWMMYSEVDLSLNNGAGGMVVTNQFLMSTTSEKLAATRSCNGTDIWVLGMERNFGRFHAFSVTAAGVNTTPVISMPGFTHGPSLGCLKASPKGDKLAAAFRQGAPYDVMLFDFNNEYGIVTAPVSLGAVPGQGQYGVEFSPGGSKLYVTNADDTYGTQNTIFQYDLVSGIPETMRASRTLIGTSHASWSLGTLQRAPNGRIYVTQGLTPALGEIRHPDLAGPACTYVDFAVELQRPIYGFGLANMVPARVEQFPPLLTGPRELCPHFGTATYTLSCTGLDVTMEHHGPSQSLGLVGRTFTLDVQEAGVDTLVVHYDNDCGIAGTDTVLIRVGMPTVDLGPDTAICSTGHLVLDAGSDGVDWAWQNGAGQPLGYQRTLDVTGPGTYTVAVTNAGGCTATDAITVTSFPSTFQFSLGPDRTVCPGPPVPVTLHAPPIDALAYHWINGASTDSMTINSLWPSAWLTITDLDGCTYTDTLLLVREDTAAFAVDLGPDAAVCPGQVWPLDAGSCAGCTYHWHDGSTEHGFTAFGPGTYSVEVISACHAHATDAVTLTAAPAPALDLGPDQLLCPFAPFTLDPGLTGVTYHWEDGSTAPTHVVDSPDLYWVTVMSNAGCSATDSLEVSTCTGIAGTTDGGAVRVQPNPANEGFRLTIVGRAQGPVELLDALGRVVRSTPLVQDIAGAHADVATDRLANGAYVVRLREREDIAVRVVVAH